MQKGSDVDRSINSLSYVSSGPDVHNVGPLGWCVGYVTTWEITTENPGQNFQVHIHWTAFG
ncbi:hypothetical protein KDK95_13090 [Actinospica sp. MGRD01-02]|uniref:Uncharacterized protein n=1 Tax=Actinospica acidithermotolerans TaxID=2828514 RepID=A0A941IL29_9ACTN|nr:hypothetical protein [Actinospica acidithermotolerans]MBR7827246.1 hypothetical protein [Actinospica acidithermotolerans]